ncbi:hypothetical protein ACO2Q8_16405 [Larkinella sp. VNQ87]|uniref:hypothetical protein n=1 Tax=Larkinella sp. VNQ87 TaxID=3400921 RepID=UPI003BFDB98E
MKKSAYHYLFEQDTLFQSPEPEPVVRKTVPANAPIVQPEPVVDEPSVAEIQTEPIQAGPIQAGPIQAGPIQAGPIQAGPIQPEPVLTEPILVEPEPAQPIITPEPVPAPVTLVETATPTPPAATPPLVEPISSKTVAEKPKVLVLIDEELTPSELIFLENILKAIKLSIDDIDMLNLAGSGLVDFHAVLENKKLHHFISFGVPFKTIHLNIQMDRYEPIRIFGITFLLADPLSAIEADQKLKRKLWAVLKQVFLD